MTEYVLGEVGKPPLVLLRIHEDGTVEHELINMHLSEDCSTWLFDEDLPT